mgnify:CR=1 FL=1|tara:strand:+ start:225 stop:440 length:216 start_codon:yes stop_codon:yes gene_type:complete
MACHITRTSIITGLTMYYAGDQRWVESFSDRKVYDTESEANTTIAPTTSRIGDKDISNANGSFKNATIVNE